MLDYAAWLARAQDFTSGLTRLPGNVTADVEIAPPLSGAAREELESSLSFPLPLSLRLFLVQGSGDCYCRYVWEPPPEMISQHKEILPYGRDIFGGLRYWNSDAILSGWQHCQQLAAEAVAASEPQYQEYWQQKLPFAFILNGDYLALDLSQQDLEPPVVYISHEGEEDGGVIAPSFDAFLQTWEQLCYVGPEAWLLGEFRDPASRLLDPRSDKAKKLRQLLRAEL
jgi:hypothetical protein